MPVKAQAGAALPATTVKEEDHRIRTTPCRREQIQLLSFMRSVAQVEFADGAPKGIHRLRIALREGGGCRVQQKKDGARCSLPQSGVERGLVRRSVSIV